MSIDSIGNFLTTIRNASMVSKPFVVVQHSIICAAIADILFKEGFIKSFEEVKSDNGFKQLKLFLKYVNGESVIHSLVRVSKPGRRMYSSVANLEHVIGGLGISILSTNRGIMTDKQARDSKVNVSGEIICTVW